MTLDYLLPTPHKFLQYFIQNTWILQNILWNLFKMGFVAGYGWAVASYIQLFILCYLGYIVDTSVKSTYKPFLKQPIGNLHENGSVFSIFSKISWIERRDFLCIESIPILPHANDTSEENVSCDTKHAKWCRSHYRTIRTVGLCHGYRCK